MPNVNKPAGLAPVQYLSGSPWSGQARLYSIDANYATALYIGDPVIGGGSADVVGIPNIVIAGVTGAIRGVIVGLGTSRHAVIANPSDLTKTYRPASDPAVWYAMVVDDPNVIFEVQEESNGTQLAATEIGLNTVLKSGTGNSFVSGWQIPSASGATPATTATLQVRLLGLAQRTDNAFGAYAKHLIKINVHELGTGTGAAGV